MIPSCAHAGPLPLRSRMLRPVRVLDRASSTVSPPSRTRNSARRCCMSRPPSAVWRRRQLRRTQRHRAAARAVGTGRGSSSGSRRSSTRGCTTPPGRPVTKLTAAVGAPAFNRPGARQRAGMSGAGADHRRSPSGHRRSSSNGGHDGHQGRRDPKPRPGHPASHNSELTASQARVFRGSGGAGQRRRAQRVPSGDEIPSEEHGVGPSSLPPECPDADARQSACSHVYVQNTTGRLLICALDGGRTLRNTRSCAKSRSPVPLIAERRASLIAKPARPRPSDSSPASPSRTSAMSRSSRSCSPIEGRSPAMCYSRPIICYFY